MNTKTCPQCKENKPSEAFSRCGYRKDGLQPYCKTCTLARQRDHYHKNRCAYLNKNALKRKHLREIIVAEKSKPCTDCKHVYPPFVMDFDHLHGKSMVVSKLVNYCSEKRLREEIAKCEVVCSNCHRLRTYARKLVHPLGL